MKKLNIHFVGIKGVGMTPLAIMAKEAGFDVSGCDNEYTYITDHTLSKVGITPLVGFSSNHLDDIDLLITTGAHGGFKNPEVMAAKEMGIQVLTQGEAVGYFMSGKLFNRLDIEGISVAGCHGKTTTTAMIATMFSEAKLDPSYLIGTSIVKPLGLPGHYGNGKYLIAEADEYATEPNADKTAKFLWQHPKIAIFTNIEWDHPDIYPSLKAVEKAFLLFANNVEKILIINGDDPQLQKLRGEYKKPLISFGIQPVNGYQIKDIKNKEDITSFTLYYNGKKLEDFILSVSGEHNIYNATAAIIAGCIVNIPLSDIKKALLKFSGTKRRLEFLGETADGAFVYDDYAHHPTAIKKTLKAVHEKYPDKKIVCIFEPHTYSRTKILLEDFSSSFSDADIVIIKDIYPSQREKPDGTISSEILVEKIKHYHHNVYLLPNESAILAFLDKKKYNRDYLIVIMGAGDIYKIRDRLVTGV